jgi:hypothetical protein
MPLSTKLKLGLLLPGFDETHDLVELDFRDEGAVERIGLFADGELFDGVEVVGEELVVDGGLDEDSGADNAGLCVEGGGGGRCKGKETGRQRLDREDESG